MFFRKTRTASNDNAGSHAAADDAPLFTLIAPGARINGNVDSDGDVQVEGRVRGHVHAAGITVAADGMVEGEAVAEEAIIQGHVRGPVRARHIHLLPGALVEGNLTCITISIDPGARLSGTIRQEQPGNAAEALFRPAPDQAVPASSQRGARAGDGVRPLAAARPRATGF